MDRSSHKLVVRVHSRALWGQPSHSTHMRSTQWQIANRADMSCRWRGRYVCKRRPLSERSVHRMLRSCRARSLHLHIPGYPDPVARLVCALRSSSQCSTRLHMSTPRVAVALLLFVFGPQAAPIPLFRRAFPLAAAAVLLSFSLPRASAAPSRAHAVAQRSTPSHTRQHENGVDHLPHARHDAGAAFVHCVACSSPGWSALAALLPLRPPPMSTHHTTNPSMGSRAVCTPSWFWKSTGGDRCFKRTPCGRWHACSQHALSTCRAAAQHVCPRRRLASSQQWGVRSRRIVAQETAAQFVLKGNRRPGTKRQK
jgi:hypothetical protein